MAGPQVKPGRSAVRFARKWPQAMRDRARDLHAAGVSFVAIGRELQVPPRTVRGWAEEEGWPSLDAAAATARPAAALRRRRLRVTRPEERQAALDRTWDLVLREHALVLELPATNAVELARFECEMRRLTLLVGLLAKLAPLVKTGPAPPTTEVPSDVCDPIDLGPLLEEVARRFEAFDAGEPPAAVPGEPASVAAPGVS